MDTTHIINHTWAAYAHAKVARKLMNMSGAVFATCSSATAPLDAAALALSVAHGAVGMSAVVQFACAKRAFHTHDRFVDSVLHSCRVYVINVLGRQEA
eukprot:6518951-Pyramimonas_sp.AAC.1